MHQLGKKQQVILIFLCFVLTLFAQSSLLLAEEGDTSSPITLPTEYKDFRDPAEVMEQDIKEKQRQQFLENIRAEIRGSEKELFDLNANVKDAEGRLDNVHSKITTLSGQLANLDEQIKNTEQLIYNTSLQITEKENQIIILYGEIDMKNVEIEHQKQMLVEYLKTLYTQESALTDTMTGNQEINIAKLLLSNESIGDQLQKIKYFNILEEKGHEIFQKLEILVDELEEDKELTKLAKNKLVKLSTRLQEEKENLQAQREGKAHLLEITRGEEEIYQNLIDETKKQQAEIYDELKELRENLAFIQEEMDTLGDHFDPSNYRHLFSGEKTSIYAYINAYKDDESGFRLSWPVDPKRGISAYFHDSSYASVFGVGHNAIDIPTAQKTTVRAPAEGIVYKVRDNGYGYSYLILAHKGGYMTVYGHVYEFLVEPGEKIRPGQAIALSGGTPGTKGAGYMTTGAHLHFEVMKGGSYVDPLTMLPLSALDYDSLPEKYQLLADSQVRKVKRVVSEWINARST